METKQKVLNYLLLNGTIDPFAQDFSQNVTEVISSKLNISRTLASQYLNELYKNKQIIKIISRPVLYISAKKVTKELNTHVTKYEFEDIDEYKEWYMNINSNDGIIGSTSSLLYAIIQIQTGLLYPNYGLPVILSGNTGSGRKFLISNLLSSNIRKNRLSRNWKIITLYAGDFKEVKGLQNEIRKWLKSDFYILFYLVDFALYPKLQLIKLVEYLMKFKEKKLPFNLILEMNEKDLGMSYSSLMEMIPMIAKIPDLKERPLLERRAIIIQMLEKEANKLNKQMLIESFVFNIFEQISSQSNLKTLNRIVKQATANAYQMQMSQDKIIIHASNLPSDVSYQIQGENDLHQKSELIDLDEMDFSTPDYSLYTFCLEFMKNYESNQTADIDTLCQTQFYLICSYIDKQIDSYYYKEMKQTVIMQIIKNIIRLFEDTLNIYLPIGFAYLIAQFSDLTYLPEEYQKLIHLNEAPDVKELQRCLETVYGNSYRYANRFMVQLNHKGNIVLSPLLIIMLTICIEIFNRGKHLQKIGALIISHGASTATSISDTVNFLLGNKIFTALDMQMSMSVKDVALKLNDYLIFHDLYDYLIILVDMGSLTEIMNYIEHKQNFTYGIINNLSTALALDVGLRIKQGQDFYEVIKETVNGIKNEYKIIQPEQKKKAIIITSDLGRKTAKKIATLFRNSLPEPHPFTIIEYDFEQLQEKKSESLVFKEYDVKLLICPDNLKIDTVIGLSLEDVIYMSNIDKLNMALNKYFTQEQINIFHLNLVKNFSLENVVENLTILNARHLMDLVVESVEKLTQNLKKYIDAKARIGIYIHICFLVERLVTKNEIQTDIEVTKAFLQSNEEFINSVKKSFENILESYSVQLPVSEIKYLYDYIYEQEEEKSEQTDYHS